MAQYDPSIIQAFAEALYARANTIITIYTIAGISLGGLGGLVVGQGVGMVELIAGIAAVIGGYIGYGIGQGKAFELKLQAQMALCQVQIEANTHLRPSARTSGTGQRSSSSRPSQHKHWENVTLETETTDSVKHSSDQEELIFCYHCGAELTSAATKCPQCGKAL